MHAIYILFALKRLRRTIVWSWRDIVILSPVVYRACIHQRGRKRKGKGKGEQKFRV